MSRLERFRKYLETLSFRRSNIFPVSLASYYRRVFPFLRWFPLRRETLKADWIAGLTVALVLIPQSMAYAHLAGMPVQYGLYAAFLPVIIGALWGSSSQLSTGPAAMAALLTATALASMATAGSEQYIALAIVLSLLVGLVRLSLGVFKLGAIVAFLSHPVVVGFTNAAALIICLSQLPKLLGVPLGRSENFIRDAWDVATQVTQTHIPTLLFGLGAFAIMWGFKKYRPTLPGVLVAVMLATAVSWAIGFERVATAKIEQIVDRGARQTISEFDDIENQIASVNQRIIDNTNELRALSATEGGDLYAASLAYRTQLLRLDLRNLENEKRKRERAVRQYVFEMVPGQEDLPPKLYLQGQAEAGGHDRRRWHIKEIDRGTLGLIGGGEVVGTIPRGLPDFGFPEFNWTAITALFTSALVITLVGFMEAISVAKSMAAKTKERIDPNQELIGQGLANLAASFSQTFPVSGSFSRSAINLQTGAITGISSVFAGLIVLVFMLLLTPLLYHLPQAVLAAIILLAVSYLFNFNAMKHAWQTHRHDGIAAVVTFVATLGFAPHLNNGILAGAGLAVILYLIRTMKPRVVVLSRHSDGTLRDARFHNLKVPEHIIAIRFDGSLYFANVPYFEDAILEVAADQPQAKYILVVGDGINELDASGEEAIRHLVERLQQSQITLVFSGLKRQVLQVMDRTGLYAVIGAQHFFRTEDMALDAIYQWIHDESFDASFCPLTPKAQMEASVSSISAKR
ncbi:MAG: SulP family inorganic anion transporter [Burkholderiales bacterium]